MLLELTEEQIEARNKRIRLIRRFFREERIRHNPKTPQEEYRAYAIQHTHRTVPDASINDPHHLAFFKDLFMLHIHDLVQINPIETIRLIDIAIAFYQQNYPQFLNDPAFTDLYIIKAREQGLQLLQDRKFDNAAVLFKEAIQLEKEQEKVSGIKFELMMALTYAGKDKEAAELANTMELQEGYSLISILKSVPEGINILLQMNKETILPIDFSINNALGKKELDNKNYKVAKERFESALFEYEGPNNLVLAEMYFDLGICLAHLDKKPNQSAGYMYGIAMRIATEQYVGLFNPIPRLEENIQITILLLILKAVKDNPDLLKLNINESFRVFSDLLPQEWKIKFKELHTFYNTIIEKTLIWGKYTLAFCKQLRNDGHFAQSQEILQTTIELFNHGSDNAEIKAWIKDAQKDSEDLGIVEREETVSVVAREILNNLQGLGHQIQNTLPPILNVFSGWGRQPIVNADIEMQSISSPLARPQIAQLGPR